MGDEGTGKGKDQKGSVPGVARRPPYIVAGRRKTGKWKKGGDWGG